MDESDENLHIYNRAPWNFFVKLRSVLNNAGNIIDGLFQGDRNLKFEFYLGYII